MRRNNDCLFSMIIVYLLLTFDLQVHQSNWENGSPLFILPALAGGKSEA